MTRLLCLALLPFISAAGVQVPESASDADVHRSGAPDRTSLRSLLRTRPKPAPERWRGLIGEYGPDQDAMLVLEKGGRLIALLRKRDSCSLEQVSQDVYRFPACGNYGNEQLRFTRDIDGRALRATAGAIVLEKRQAPAEGDAVFRIKPLRPVEELRQEALKSEPPVEKGPFRPSTLVSLTDLDPTIKLDIRYATSRDFLGTPVYTQARAFLQSPAAEALVRAHKRLKEAGYGLLIHDAYRPWYVTKIFWDATPEEWKIFVADPKEGSRHNRGCAVDLTLFDLDTDKPVEMTGVYDEMSPRSYPDYPGGTSLQRWHRDLLRRAMEEEGFRVFAVEWWHFDYKDWRSYGIQNVDFAHIGQ